MEGKKIFRSIDDNIIAGVCGGLAEYFKIDSTIVRIIFVLLALSGGSGILIYLILWFVAPIKKGEIKDIDREKNIKDFTDDVKGKAKSMAKEIKFDTKIKKTGKSINIFGMVLILVGAVAIWNQISPIRIDWNFFWPGILIVIGVLFLFK